MNTKLKGIFTFAAAAAFPWILGAQEFRGHEYDNTGWRKNVTLSVGATAMRSNATYNGDKSGNSLSADPKWGFGAMTAVEVGLADYAGIAVGLHYLDRKFQISGGAVDWTRSIPTLLIPVEARFYLLKIVSIGAGGFAAFPVGSTQDSFKSGNSTLVTSGSDRNGVDYGLTGALGVNVPIGTLGIFGEARYNYGLSDSASNADVEEKMRDLLFTVGVKVKI